MGFVNFLCLTALWAGVHEAIVRFFH
jgi:hypothetical protein